MLFVLPEAQSAGLFPADRFDSVQMSALDFCAVLQKRKKKSYVLLVICFSFVDHSLVHVLKCLVHVNSDKFAHNYTPYSRRRLLHKLILQVFHMAAKFFVCAE